MAQKLLLIFLAVLLSSACNDYLTDDVYIGVVPGEDGSDPVDDGSDGEQVLADDDDDGLGNEVEATFSMPPRLADADKDGYADGLEFVVDTGDPLDSSVTPAPLRRAKQLSPSQASQNNTDRDSDGLGDAFEQQHGLDPDSPDTDGDGYADGLELVANSNPFDSTDRPRRQAAPIRGIDNGLTQAPADTDRDGISDNLEALNGTSSERRDSDGDGFSDGLEYLMGSDATSFLSVPDFRVPAPPESSLGDQNTTSDTSSSGDIVEITNF